VIKLKIIYAVFLLFLSLLILDIHYQETRLGSNWLFLPCHIFRSVPNQTLDFMRHMQCFVLWFWG